LGDYPFILTDQDPNNILGDLVYKNMFKRLDYINKLLSILILTSSFIVGVACNKSYDPPPYYEAVTYDWGSDWSPDSTTIVFMRLAWPQRDILGGMFFYDLIDSTLTRFLENTFYRSPDFSPDGNWIAYSWNGEIFRIKTNGDSLEQLTNTSNNIQPHWSPNGKQIAYNHLVGEDRGIYIYDLISNKSKYILPYSEMPVWFPDNERLAIVSNNFQSGPELAIIDTTGEILQRLTDSKSFKTTLDVSPDGTKICFYQKYQTKIGELWLINSDGTGLIQLTQDGGEYPSFSPDGNWIVYTHTGSNDGSLWIISINGNLRRRITSYGLD